MLFFAMPYYLLHESAVCKISCRIVWICDKKYIIGYNERYIRIAVNADEIKDAQSKCNTITDVEIIGKADDDDIILGKINDNI